MTRQTLTLTLALVTLAVVSGVGAAAPSPQIDDPRNNSTTDDPDPRDGQLIEPGLRLVDATLSDGTASLTLLNTGETPTRITVTDAGAVFEGGQVAQRDAIIRPGTESVEISVSTTRGGAAGVTIATASTLFGVPLRDGFNISTPVESEWLALGTGVGITLVAAILLKRRRDRIRDKGVVRVDG